MTDKYSAQFKLHQISANWSFRTNTRDTLVNVQSANIVHYGLNGAVNSNYPTNSKLAMTRNYALSTAPSGVVGVAESKDEDSE